VGSSIGETPVTGSLTVPEMILPQHSLTRYVRVGLSVTDGTMVWRLRRLVLGVVPFGSREVRVPVARVASMQLHDRTMRPWQWVFTVGLIAAAALFTPWWVMTPLILLGVWAGLVSIGPSLRVTTIDDAVHRAAVCFGHRIDAELFIEAVTDMAQEARRNG
jgi:hypothetical protein